MSTQNWLTLMDYSAKHRVSLSTLRRRIKGGEIEYKFSDGKYLLKDGPLQVKSPEAEAIAPPTSVSPQSSQVKKPEPPTTAKVSTSADQYWEGTQSLLNEIKRAYSLILQEKEEQILQLKDEVADLKTLVRVLEDDNLRIKNAQSPRHIKTTPLPSSPSSDYDLDLDVDLGLEL